MAPKKVSGKYTFIQNLSYPYDEEAVNISIPQNKASVHFSTVDDAISHIKGMGVNAYMAKNDICDPFWHSESDVARAEYLVSPIMP